MTDTVSPIAPKEELLAAFILLLVLLAAPVNDSTIDTIFLQSLPLCPQGTLSVHVHITFLLYLCVFTKHFRFRILVSSFPSALKTLVMGWKSIPVDYVLILICILTTPANVLFLDNVISQIHVITSTDPRNLTRVTEGMKKR